MNPALQHDQIVVECGICGLSDGAKHNYDVLEYHHTFTTFVNAGIDANAARWYVMQELNKDSTLQYDQITICCPPGEQDKELIMHL